MMVDSGFSQWMSLASFCFIWVQWISLAQIYAKYCILGLGHTKRQVVESLREGAQSLVGSEENQASYSKCSVLYTKQ